MDYATIRARAHQLGNCLASPHTRMRHPDILFYQYNLLRTALSSALVTS